MKMRIPSKFFYLVCRNTLPYVLIILFVLFFFGGPDYSSSRHFKAFWNLGHIVFFSLLPFYVFSGLKRFPGGFAFQSLLTIVMCITLGAVIELFQYGFQRTPDLGDISRNVIGGLVGSFFLLPSRKSVQKKLLTALQATTVFLVGLQVYPLLIAVSDEYLARNRFPVLSSFETPWEIQRWSGSTDYAIDDSVHLDGKYSMRVRLRPDLYSGVSLSYFPENWEGAKSFRFSVFNPSADILYITCRIHDQKHNEGRQTYGDRFNRRCSLPSGWCTIEIGIEDIERGPKERRMDLRHIKGVGFFAMRLPRSRVIYLDNVRLVY